MVLWLAAQVRQPAQMMTHLVLEDADGLAR